MEIVAHSGRPNTDYPANSAAGLLALDPSVIDRIEYDIFVDRDGRPWIAHDQESINEQTLPLAEGLKIVADLGLPVHADLKSSGSERSIVEAHRQAGLLPRTLFCGHDLATLARVRDLASSSQIGWSIPQFHVAEPLVGIEALPADLPELVVRTCVDYRIDGIMSHWVLVDQALSSALKQAGLFLHVWTVDQIDLARDMARFVPESLTSNHPQMLRSALS